jgi:hypothetical protein
MTTFRACLNFFALGFRLQRKFSLDDLDEFLDFVIFAVLRTLWLGWLLVYHAPESAMVRKVWLLWITRSFAQQASLSSLAGDISLLWEFGGFTLHPFQRTFYC